MAAEPKKTLDIYDQEFRVNLDLAKNLINKLPSANDKAICKKWVSRLCALKATDVVVKRNRNSFFKFFLQILHKASQGPEAHYGYPQFDDQFQETRNFMCKWSQDLRTYIAAKPLPGRGTLVYMAVSKDPDMGWEFDGVTAYV